MKEKYFRLRTYEAVPVASPYYDRLRALSIELGLVTFGSPEYQFLNEQIKEMNHRARKRMMIASVLENRSEA